MIVAACFSISAAIFAASSGLGYVTIFTPSIIGYQSVTVQPKLWKSGSEARRRSSEREAEHHRELRDVPEDVAMRQRDAFRHAGAAAREEQDRFAAIAAARHVQQRRQANVPA